MTQEEAAKLATSIFRKQREGHPNGYTDDVDTEIAASVCALMKKDYPQFAFKPDWDETLDRGGMMIVGIKAYERPKPPPQRPPSPDQIKGEPSQNMSPAQFRAALQTLGMSVNDFARIIGINSRNVARYCDDRGDGPSPSAEYCIKAMLAFERIASQGIPIEREALISWAHKAQDISDRALKGEFDE